MNPNIEARINAARSPDELKRAVVDAMHELWAAVEQQPADPWATQWATQWESHPDNYHGIPIEVDPNVPPGEVRVRIDNGVAIASVQHELDTATDPEDILALTARLRLLQDDGQPHSTRKPDGQRAAIQVDGKKGRVELPEVPPAVKKTRYAWAMKNKLHEFLTGSPLEKDPSAAAEAYSIGGPMWLYLGNRNAIMQMPAKWRVEMVRDVQEISPADAHELARDILKQEDSLNLDSAAAQRALRKAAEYGE